MKDEMNIPEDFERFLKTQADKARMYPGGSVWRGIHQHLHGKSRWPALTFMAIFIGALLMTLLILFHSDKEVFKAPTIITADGKQITLTPTAFSSTEVTDNTFTYLPLNGYAIAYYPGMQHTAVNTLSTNNVGIKNSRSMAVASDNKDIARFPGNDRAVYLSYINSEAAHLLTPAEESVLKGVHAIMFNNLLSDHIAIAENNVPLPAVAMTDATHDLARQANGLAVLSGKKSKRHFKIHLYGGSNISYRILTEPQSNNGHIFYNPVLTGNPRYGVKNFVKQRPLIGFELGTALSYSINEKVSIKAGIQFNYRQYAMDAYYTPASEQALLLWNNSGRPDSAHIQSNLQNAYVAAPGFEQKPLRNAYFQIGLPIGIDWTFAQKNKFSFTMGTSFQPTYQLNTDPYIVTSDYKSYVQRPDWIRRLNFNVSTELMVNFKSAGGFQWQAGPQIRYQLLPTQIKSYSIHEYLIDYGIKVGVVKRLN